jgi:diguanylate cyclase (GGDEF)-like protein
MNSSLMLIADDEKSVRIAVRMALKGEKFEFIEAADGIEAFKKCVEYKPDIILIDALMPKQDGFETVKKIRATEEFKETPILMITSLNSKEYKIKALEIGVSDFITKPFDKEELVARCKSYAAISNHIKKRKEAEKLQEREHKYLQSIIDCIDDTVMVISKDYEILLMNKSVKNKLDETFIQDLNHPKCYEVSHHRTTPCEGKEHICPLKEVLEKQKAVNVTHNHSTKKESNFIELSATPYYDEINNVLGIIEVGRDITKNIKRQQELKKQKDELIFLSEHDPLTGLANKFLFNLSLKQAIKRVKRNRLKFALFFIDLDDFKHINDTYGHDCGDYVLKNVARRIKESVREVDVVSRIGGDEFTLILEEIKDINSIKKIAEKLIKNVSKTINYKGNVLTISISVGISVSPDESLNHDELFKFADKAMYAAKNSGKNTFVIYHEMEKKLI